MARGRTELAITGLAEAVKWYEKAEKVGITEAGAIHEVAYIFYLSGHYDSAEQLTQRFLEISKQTSGGDAAVYSGESLLAMIYVGEGRYASAEVLCVRALA